MIPPWARPALAITPLTQNFHKLSLLGLLVLTTSCSSFPSDQAIAPIAPIATEPETAADIVFDAQSPAPVATPAPNAPWPQHYSQALDHGMAAAVATQTAQSASDWRQVQGQWERAISTLATIPTTSNLFATAQQKRQEYEKNLAYAAQVAESKSLPTATVVSVGDGDTLRIQGQGGPITCSSSRGFQCGRRAWWYCKTAPCCG
jgi:hypothetical protein